MNLKVFTTIIQKIKFPHACNNYPLNQKWHDILPISIKFLSLTTPYLTNPKHGSYVSYDTHKLQSPVQPRIFPTCPSVWTPQQQWCAQYVTKDHLAEWCVDIMLEMGPSEEFAKCGSKPTGTPNKTAQRRQQVHCSDVAHFCWSKGRHGNENKAQHTFLESIVVRVFI